MKLRITAACAALATFTAGQALAESPITAKLAAPVAAKVRFIAGGAMFECEADACVSVAPQAQTFTVAACKTIANKVGAVTSFTGRKPLDADRLAACNAKAKGAVAASAES